MTSVSSAASGRSESSGAEGPAGSAHNVVAQAWAALLGSTPTRPTDDFFTAGGDSLKAIRLVAAIRDRIGVEVPFRAVFDNSTYAELVDVVVKAWSDPAGSGDGSGVG
jgi:acyl carrier protein